MEVVSYQHLRQPSHEILMLLIIHSKNTVLGNKARNKRKQTLKKSYSDKNGELQVIQFNERI